MASLVQLRRKIRTAKNVSKATRAMQMIAASKLRRAQEAATSSRPYAERLMEMLQVAIPKLEKGIKHPYLMQNQSKKKMYIIVSPDKGLAGGMIANLARETLKTTQNEDAMFVNIGKKMEHVLMRSKKQVVASFPFGNVVPTYAMVRPVIDIVDESYLKGEIGSIWIIYTKFTSSFSQTPTTTQILPFSLVEKETTEKKSLAIELVEPSPEEIIPGLLKHYMEMVLYQSLLESYASEQAARMAAMQSATDNANEMVADYTLTYNKLRQEKITGEILDIAGGATALAAA